MFKFKNKYKIIACVNNSGCIGKDGQLLYRVRGDLKNFSLLTTGNVVIMGRKTFESLPDGLPLKNRINIVVTSKDGYCPTECKDKSLFENTYICNSFEEVDDLSDTVGALNTLVSDKDAEYTTKFNNIDSDISDLGAADTALDTKIDNHCSSCIGISIDSIM